MDKIELINTWYDNAWSNLEVIWFSKEGNSYTPTIDDRVWVLVDQAGNLSGFMVWGIGRAGDVEVANLELIPAELEPALPAVSLGRLATGRKELGPSAVRAVNTVEITNISIHTEKSGDCFEVYWAKKSGAEYAPTTDDRVQALTDSAGNILGFKISGISLMGEGEKDFINVDLYPANTHS